MRGSRDRRQDLTQAAEASLVYAGKTVLVALGWNAEISKAVVDALGKSTEILKAVVRHMYHFLCYFW